VIRAISKERKTINRKKRQNNSQNTQEVKPEQSIDKRPSKRIKQQKEEVTFSEYNTNEEIKLEQTTDDKPSKKINRSKKKEKVYQDQAELEPQLYLTEPQRNENGLYQHQK